MTKLFKIAAFSLYLIANTSVGFADDCVFSLHGKCYDCNSKYALKVGSKDNCEVNCPNRIYVFKDRTCRLKVGETVPFPSSGDTSVSSSRCTLAEDEPSELEEGASESYFKGANGKCYPCKTAEAVAVSSDDCSEKRFCNLNCSKRTRKHYNSSSNLYSVLRCPSNRPLMDRYMMCWKCDEKTPVDMSFDLNRHNSCKSQRRMNDSDKPFSYLK